MNNDLEPEFRDSKEAFENAIKTGAFSVNEASSHYVGHFMYMYSQNGIDYFKHSLTRKYLEVKQ